LGTVFTLDLTTGFTSSDAALTALATAMQNDSKIALATVLPVSGSTSDDRKIRFITEPGNEVSSISYTWTGGASQGTIILNTLDGVVNAEDEVIFKLPIKYHGASYNDVYYVISDASNGDDDYFDLTVVFDGQNITEEYKNLTIESTTIGQAHYLDKILQTS